MSEKLQYVSPEYQAQLSSLADRLCTPKTFGSLALDDTIEFTMPESVFEDSNERTR